MRSSAAFLFVGALAGCVSLPKIPDSGAAELTWQALHAIDVGQTITIARSPESLCESAAITSRLIGQHPSEAAVYGWGVGLAVLHYTVSAWLDHETDAHDGRGWRIARFTWHALTIWDTAEAVGHNFSIGITPFDGADHSAALADSRRIVPLRRGAP